MRHLDDAAAIRLAEGAGEDEARAHAAQCSRCANLVEQYQAVLDAVQAARRTVTELPSGLMRWARAYTRTVVPERRSRFLPFLAQGATAVAAVRSGQQPGVAMLYGDEQHHLDVRMEPQRRGGHRLHGQLVPLQDASVAGWLVTAVAASGQTRQTTTNEAGEFWFDAVTSGEGLSLVAEKDNDRIVVVRVLTHDPDLDES